MYAVFKYSKSANIGDDIMTIAVVNIMAEYGVRPTFYVDRDTGAISHYKNKYKNIPLDSPINLILYGWHDGEYTAWPLPSNITRILVMGLHVNEVKKDESYNWLSKKPTGSIFDNIEVLDGLKLGMRDTHSYAKAVYAARKASIRAEIYVSGCVTMTLKNNQLAPLASCLRSGVYIVDIYPKDLRGKVPDEILDDAMECSHFYTGNIDLPGAHKVKVAAAKQMLNIYMQAKLVITSRLHCLLPCLAFQTPVLFYPYNVDLADVRLTDYLGTVPVIGRDTIDYSDIKNILPVAWDTRVKYMRNEIREWILES